MIKNLILIVFTSLRYSKIKIIKLALFQTKKKSVSYNYP